ncbi:hypothetical protein I7X12_07770 [Halosimplex litoreum]|uniref:Uncharacterized protein n=1 Tax=Halosimplex litoreum TaxID=1198301 RepID=A0A7T3KWX6_9EURY|nr:hypothetical protein [Halosimplex litoreum]QPV64498.1 hypothetical protein I7X12_07770 [Halosimplex litoreum]
MQTRGLTRREKLESELAEIRDEKRKVSRRLDDLEDDEQRVQQELEQYTGKLDTRISEVVDGLDWLTRVHPELRPHKEYTEVVRKKTGLNHSMLVDLCEAVDVHYSAGDVLNQHRDELDDRGIGFDELDEHPLHDAEAGDKLTEDEIEAVSEYLQQVL